MRRDRLESSQKTVWYYPEAPTITDPKVEKRYKYFELLQCHMLIEDVYTQVFPIGGRSKNEAFKVQLSPFSEPITQLVASALNSRDRGWRNELSASLADFFQDCSQSLITFGEVVYEIVYFSNPDDHKIVEFELQRVRPFTVKRQQGQLVQIVPREVVQKRGCSAFIVLPSERILVFRLASKLQQSLERTLDSLAVLSQKLMPDFALKDFPHSAQNYHYDSSNQVHSQKLALAEAGKAIGWNARGLFQEDVLEFYSLKRHLLFERFKIELRNSILTTLNHGLKLAGKEMGFSAEIIIEGLPTIDHVEKAESELESGTRPFAEIYKPFLIY
ncbi:MAG TPA: hypothetical protein VGR94_05675 [Candidatus Acidoferrales bacterium]|nr:hypothetical protein [Candidatus Acidoferrales bacterium]